jgi:hypothetical protein
MSITSFKFLKRTYLIFKVEEEMFVEGGQFIRVAWHLGLQRIREISLAANFDVDQW